MVTAVGGSKIRKIGQVRNEEMQVAVCRRRTITSILQKDTYLVFARFQTLGPSCV